MEQVNPNDYVSEEALSDLQEPEEVPLAETVGEEVPDELAARFVPESLEAIKGQIMIEDTPIHQFITIINANRHLILTGSPGTGKTTIAINASEQAVRTNFISGYVLTTATSDWTTFDTIGGYMPQANQKLVFTAGIVLRAICENKWLVIDEINRADIDKAFGQLLTILSGQDVELPFTDEQGKQIRICHAKGLSSYYDKQSATYCVGDNWRIIGTMNTFDKNSLFSLSYATSTFLKNAYLRDMGLPTKITDMMLQRVRCARSAHFKSVYYGLQLYRRLLVVLQKLVVVW